MCKIWCLVYRLWGFNPYNKICQENVKDQFYSSYKTYVKDTHPPMSLWTGEAGLGRAWCYLTTNDVYKSC